MWILGLIQSLTWTTSPCGVSGSLPITGLIKAPVPVFDVTVITGRSWDCIVFRGIDDLGAELDAAKIFTTDSVINPSGQDLFFQTADDTGTLQTGLYIDAFQQIAIAKSPATAQLDVGGSLNIDGIAEFQNRLALENATNQNQGLRFTHPAGGASGVVNMYYNGLIAGSRFVISRAATGGAEIELESDGDINLNRSGNGGVLIGGLGNYADDAAAQAGGVPINGLYRNGNDLKIRVT